jgi:histone acetyltransferase (RNA polymerase elongator complex component)
MIWRMKRDSPSGSEVKKMGGLFNFEKEKKAKEFVQAFLDAHKDKEKLDRWKEENKKAEIKKDTFSFFF